MKTRFKHIFRFTMIALLLAMMAIPSEIEAKRTRSGSTAVEIPDAATLDSEVSNVSKTRRSRRRTTKVETTSKTETTQTVTERTNAAAKKATASTSNSNKKAKTKVEEKPLLRFKTEKPDLLKIREETLNPSSPFYFQKLTEKYKEMEKGKKLTAQEFRYLYLGYMFQEDYDPYRTSPYAEKVEEILDATQYMRDPSVKLSRPELDSIKNYLNKALEDNPFDLRQMSYMVHVQRDRNKETSLKLWEQRLESLLGAIKSTGTGESRQNAWFVIYPMHEYDLIQLLGYEAVDYEYSDGYDYLKVVPAEGSKNQKNIPGFYFNVMVSQDQYDLKHPEGDEENVGEDSEYPDDITASEEFDYDNIPAD